MPIFRCKKKTFFVSNFRGGGGRAAWACFNYVEGKASQNEGSYRRREIFIFYDSNKVIEILNDGQTKHGNALD